MIDTGHPQPNYHVILPLKVGYEPFDEVSVNWKVAWDAVGTCAGEPIAGSKAAGSEFGPPTSSPTISGTNAPSQYKQFSLYGQGIAQGDDGSGSLADYDYIFYPNSEGCESLCVALNEESGGKIVGYTRGASLFSELRNACMCYFGEKYLTSTLPGSGNCPITAETCFTSGQALGPITSLIIDLKYETYINNAYIQTTQSTIVSSGEICLIDNYLFWIFSNFLWCRRRDIYSSRNSSGGASKRVNYTSSRAINSSCNYTSSCDSSCGRHT